MSSCHLLHGRPLISFLFLVGSAHANVIMLLFVSLQVIKRSSGHFLSGQYLQRMINKISCRLLYYILLIKRSFCYQQIRTMNSKVQRQIYLHIFINVFFFVCADFNSTVKMHSHTRRTERVKELSTTRRARDEPCPHRSVDEVVRGTDQVLFSAKTRTDQSSQPGYWSASTR